MAVEKSAGRKTKTFRKPIRMPKKPKVVPAKRRWGADVIVDMLHRYDMPYAALNPGASYRGLHDSLVNYGQNYPHMMLCQHAETAVQVAHGYAQAPGKPLDAFGRNLAVLTPPNLPSF